MEIDPDPYKLESYTITENLISVSPHVEVKKAEYTPNPPALGANHELKSFTVVIKAINTSQLVYQEPPFVDNPNVLRHSHWQEGPIHYVVATHSNPGSVKDVLKYFPRGLNERNVAFVIKKVARVLQSFHQEGLFHRDIKPGNILINKRRNPTIMVSASYYLPNHTSLTTAEPTENAPYWLPPEHRTTSYTSSFYDLPDQLLKSDIWSLGVLTMELISGMTDDISKAVFERLGPHINFRNHKKRGLLSAKFKNFVSGCLITDPGKRLTVNDLLKHDFLAADNVSSAEDFVQDIELRKELYTSSKISHWVLGQGVFLRKVKFE